MSQTNAKPAAKSRKPDSRPERTREELRAALVRLLEARQFEDILVREIAAEAGAGYATFFRHYRDKADLLDDVIQQFLAELQGPTTAFFASHRERHAATAICDFIDQNRSLSTILLTGGASAAVHRQFVKRALELAESFAGTSGSTLPGRLGVLYPVNAIIDILSWWLDEMEELAPSEVAELIDNLVLTPLSRYR